MDLTDDQKELVALFVKQEFLIGSLYKLYAKRYPEYRGFWTEMAVEESQHAALIRRITEGDSTNKIKFSEGELRSSILVSSIKFIEGIITEFRNNKQFPIAQAVGIALQLEKGLCEGKVFQHFEGDSDDVRKVMNSLNLEQGIHMRKFDKFAVQFLKKNT